jgi:uncharacterized phiE125 gp8 family phage protein
VSLSLVLTGREWGTEPIHLASKLVTPPTIEPITLAQAKAFLRVDVSDDDAQIVVFLAAARAVVEQETGRALQTQTWDHFFDALPALRRPLELPWAPLQSVTSIKSTDTAGVQTTLDAANYLVDPSSEPGRIGLADAGNWPSDIRLFQPLVVRSVHGYVGTALTVTLTSAAGVATATASGGHGYHSGDVVTHAGATQTPYNGTVDITVTGTTTYTFLVTGAPASPATGTITATPTGVPTALLQAMYLLLGHFYENRQAVDVAVKADAALPLGVAALLAPYVIWVVG